MKINGMEKLPEYLLLNTAEGMMKLEPFGEGIVRVVYTLNDHFRDAESFIVVPDYKRTVAWDVREIDDEIVFTTEMLNISINRETGAFTYTDSEGKLLVREPERGGKTLAVTDVVKNSFDHSTEVSSGVGIDGIRADAGEFHAYVDRQAFHARLEFVWGEDEALYGLGSHEEGMMNLRGQHQYLYQQNLKAVVPVLMSTNGYGILVDSYSCMAFHDDAFGSYIWCDVEDEMDYYFIVGPEFDDIIRRYRQLTGRTPMLPRWSFGYLQSKERYKSQQELIEIAQEYRNRNLPIDAVILDWKSWEGDLWGQKTFDPERFPNPDDMTKQLHDLNVKLMISVWPTMAAGGGNHEQMKEKGYLLGDQTHYDPYRQSARELYWKQANEGLFSHGVDAWWCDCTEPFEADWKGAVKPEPEERMRINTNEAKKYMDPEFINAYSLLHSKGIYEGQRSATDRKRVVNLTRSSYAGQHRYSTITWSGDTSAKWETLKKQIPDGLNFCVTGEPYWTLDIGAFFAGSKKKWNYWCKDPTIPAPWFLVGDYDDGCDDLGYRELYVRWFQYGVFLPLFRAHGTDTPREIWRFGEPGSIFFDTLVKFLNLRYRLMPYIYSLAGLTTHMDYTMMRALAFDFRCDKNVYDIKDQYMLGPAIMVCPVTRPMYYSHGSKELPGISKTRNVYLPSGCSWYDFWSGEKYEGGRYIEVAAPIDIIPLFVRAGSILPLAYPSQSSAENMEKPIEMRIYPGADGSFLYYDDAGDNYDYEKGDYEIIEISWNDKAKQLKLAQTAGERKSFNKKTIYPTIVSKGQNGGIDIGNSAGRLNISLTVNA